MKTPARRTPYSEQHPTLFDWLDKVGTFVLANLFWIIFSIPLVTLPAATAGLFATVSPWVRGKEVEVFRAFLGGMRRFWLKSTLIGLLDLLAVGWVLVNFMIIARMDIANPIGWLSRSTSLFVGLAVLMVNVYLWPLLVVFDLPIRQLIERAVKLAFAHPVWSLGLVLVTALALLLSLTLPAVVTLVVSFSACALLIHWGAWRIIRQYLSDQELAALEAPGTVLNR